MNVLFLSIENVKNFNTKSIYMDLVNKFIQKGHYVTVLSACEKRDQIKNEPQTYTSENGEIIKVNIMNVTKMDNYIAKGIGLFHLLIKFLFATKKVIKDKKYDLVLYGSPPITFYAAVKLAKNRQGAYSYLLLKDIWPYDCLFDNILTKKGWKKIAFDFLAFLARKLYMVSDKIGCMSPANIKFLLENEPEIDKTKLEVNPNSIEPYNVRLTKNMKIQLREKYGIPQEKVIFVYGGNLGAAQGIDFALDSVRASNNLSDAYFVFVGSGTERERIIQFSQEQNLHNFCILESMPKSEYELFVQACDVGLVYLNHACLAPNYPSRILTYMQAGLPLLCATDSYTDVGTIAEENGYGYWCQSNTTEGFVELVQKLCCEKTRTTMGLKSREYLDTYYTSEQSYNLIVEKIIQRG